MIKYLDCFNSILDCVVLSVGEVVECQGCEHLGITAPQEKTYSHLDLGNRSDRTCSLVERHRIPYSERVKNMVCDKSYDKR